MESKNDQVEQKLHYIRVRAKDAPDFYDSQTDIRKLLPAVFKSITAFLSDAAGDSAPFDMAEQLFNVYQIRSMEDQSCGIAELVDLLFAELDKLPEGCRARVYELVVKQLLMLYGLFIRRDSVADQATLKSMLDHCAYVQLCGALSPDTRNAVRSELQGGFLKPMQNSIGPDGSVICVEDGKCIDFVKKRACVYLNMSGRADWQKLAELCDNEFYTLSRESIPDKDKEKGLVLGLAYPTFDRPCTQLVEERNETPGEA